MDSFLMRTPRHKLYTVQYTKTNLGKPAVWANEECMWTSIPKTANMAYRQVCKQFKLLQIDYDYKPRKYSICVFRNPVHRLFSAVGEYKKRKSDKRPLAEVLEALLEDIYPFDEHIEPQLVFTQNKSYTHILKFENLIEESINIPCFSSKPNIIHNHLRQHELSPSRSKYHESDLDQLYKDNSRIVDDIINKYYSKDVLIWQNREKYIRKPISFQTV